MLLLEFSISFHLSLPQAIFLFLLPPTIQVLASSLKQRVEPTYGSHGPGFRSHFCLPQSSGHAV